MGAGRSGTIQSVLCLASGFILHVNGTIIQQVRKFQQSIELLALSLVPRHEIHEYLSKNKVCFNTHWKSSMYHSNRHTLNCQWDILGTEIYIPHHLNIKTRCLQSIMLKAIHSPISLAIVHFSQRTFPLSYDDNKWWGNICTYVFM